MSTTKTIRTQFQLKRGTSQNLSSTNPQLAEGEPCVEFDENGQVVGLKIGDGHTSFNSLNYVGGNTSSDDNGNTNTDAGVFTIELTASRESSIAAQLFLDPNDSTDAPTGFYAWESTLTESQYNALMNADNLYFGDIDNDIFLTNKETGQFGYNISGDKTGFSGTDTPAYFLVIWEDDGSYFFNFFTTDNSLADTTIIINDQSDNIVYTSEQSILEAVNAYNAGKTIECLCPYDENNDFKIKLNLLYTRIVEESSAFFLFSATMAAEMGANIADTITAIGQTDYSEEIWTVNTAIVSSNNQETEKPQETNDFIINGSFVEGSSIGIIKVCDIDKTSTQIADAYTAGKNMKLIVSNKNQYRPFEIELPFIQRFNNGQYEFAGVVNLSTYEFLMRVWISGSDIDTGSFNDGFETHSNVSTTELKYIGVPYDFEFTITDNNGTLEGAIPTLSNSDTLQFGYNAVIDRLNVTPDVYATFTLPGQDDFTRLKFIHFEPTSISASGIIYDGSTFQLINLTLNSSNEVNFICENLTPGL